MTDTIRVDLHCHSSMSDGDHSPAYVAHSIAATGALWGALTDHNSVAGQEPFRTALANRGLRSVTGLEIDARTPAGPPIHLLCYGFNPENEALTETLLTLKEPWRLRARRWVRRTRSITVRSTLHGGARTSDLQDSSPRRPPNTVETIDLIHRAGGLVFLAHPLAGVNTVARLEEMLEWLQPQGLDGLEAFHKQYTAAVQGDLLRLAERRGLLTVAGSDFHGLHHSDGGSPGVDMPLIHWNRFLDALRVWQAQTPGAFVVFDSLS